MSSASVLRCPGRVRFVTNNRNASSGLTTVGVLRWICDTPWMQGGKTLLTVQVGRALAALAVVLFHVRLLTNDLVAPLPWINSLFSQGLLGVDYFFVTSGFIILTVHGSDQRGAMPAYLWKRISRVYIPYLPIVAAIIAVYILLPTASKSPREWGWATSLLLIPRRTGSR
jgi:exopolysaccharide production protein ExoZ